MTQEELDELAYFDQPEPTDDWEARAHNNIWYVSPGASIKTPLPETAEEMRARLDALQAWMQEGE